MAIQEELLGLYRDPTLDTPALGMTRCHYAAYPKQSSGGINEESAGVALVSDGENLDLGGSQQRKITLKPGKYLFVCNIPGHFQQGMYTVVTLTP